MTQPPVVATHPIDLSAGGTLHEMFEASAGLGRTAWGDPILVPHVEQAVASGAAAERRDLVVKVEALQYFLNLPAWRVVANIVAMRHDFALE